MFIDTYKNMPDFPFNRYFESPNQYVLTQQYWLRVLRSTPGFKEENWQPVIKPVNIKDDMYIGLLVDIENLKERKVIKLHTTSICGYAHFLLKEDFSTKDAIKNLDSNFGIDSNITANLVKDLEEATNKSAQHFKRTKGFEAGVDKRDFYINAVADDIEDSYVYGEEFSIISTISSDNELKAIHALELFLQPGPAMERVNSVFVPEEER